MEKVLLLAFLFVGCQPPDKLPVKNIENSEFHIKEIEGCEYIVYTWSTPGSNGYVYSLTHKGNCKYCLNRKK
jgi:hypothetical protein